MLNIQSRQLRENERESCFSERANQKVLKTLCLHLSHVRFFLSLFKIKLIFLINLEFKVNFNQLRAFYHLPYQF